MYIYQLRLYDLGLCWLSSLLRIACFVSSVRSPGMLVHAPFSFKIAMWQPSRQILRICRNLHFANHYFAIIWQPLKSLH